MLSSIYLTGGTIDHGQLAQSSQRSGSMFGQGLGAFPDWRTFALTHLQNYGLRVVNPLELPWADVDIADALEIADPTDERVRRSLDLIDQCDGLLANLERPSYGTAMEIFYAHRRGKMVTVVGPSPFNPWVLSHSQARFSDIDRALQYIIGQQPHSAPVSWAIQNEAHLSERYEEMPPPGEPDYKFTGGELPILVVAPHATAYWRDGEFHGQESFTGSMAHLLNRMTGCHTLTSNYCLVADPCYYLNTPFRRIISDIIQAGQVGLVLMLMGSSWQEAPGLQISSYGEAQGVYQDYENRLKLRMCELEPIGTSSFDHFIKPIANYLGNDLKVPVVAMRLHKRYRMPRLQPSMFMQATEATAAFITEAGGELAKNRA